MDNTETVRRAIAANRSGDLEATFETMVSLCEPRFEFSSMLTPLEGTYQGHDGIRRYLRDMADAWHEWRNEADEIVEVEPETVLANIHFRGSGHGSGAAVGLSSAGVFVLSAGKLLSVHVYATREQALQAVELHE